MASANKIKYEQMTATIVEMLEKGQIPWQKPWDLDANGNPNLPANFVSKKPYRGVNIWLLAFTPYQSNFWITAKQIAENGGTLKEGQKGNTIPIYFYSFISYTKKDKAGNAKVNADGDEEKGQFPLVKIYDMYNVEQVEGLKMPENKFIEPKEPKSFETIEDCENIISNFSNCPKISFGGNRACYSPASDSVSMPKMEQFKSVEGFYSTFFHELTHSTGHSNRLKREGVVNFDRFGSHQYSEEELVAEMGASYLTAITGIQNSEILENSVAYLQNWIKAIKGDVSLIMKAAGKAQKATDLILGVKFEKQY